MDNQELREKIAKILSILQLSKDYQFLSDKSEAFNEATDQIITLLPPTPSCLGEEEIEKILESFVTHILWYHDKECGRTEDVAIIFKSRFKELAKALTQKIAKEPTCVDLNYNCTTAKIAEQLGIKLWQAMCMMKYVENKIARPQGDKSEEYCQCKEPKTKLYKKGYGKDDIVTTSWCMNDGCGKPQESKSTGSLGKAADTLVKPAIINNSLCDACQNDCKQTNSYILKACPNFLPVCSYGL